MAKHYPETRKSGEYEKFKAESDFLVNYHFTDKVEETCAITPAHWHEHIELLLVKQGQLRIYIHGEWISAAPGEIVVVNPDELHSIPEKSADTLYECLIPYKSLCDRMELPLEEMRIANHIRDKKYADAFTAIMDQLREQPPLYRTSVQLHLLTMVTDLLQEYGRPITTQREKGRSSKDTLVKRSITYIQKNYLNPISTDDVCKNLGFNKNYVCHSFKNITGNTMVDYLNMLRCQHAHKLLVEGKLSVADCAQQSGFNHVSYFSKTYRRHMGELPRETVKNRKKSQ